jgi:hypothetical protein
MPDGSRCAVVSPRKACAERRNPTFGRIRQRGRALFQAKVEYCLPEGPEVSTRTMQFLPCLVAIRAKQVAISLRTGSVLWPLSCH